MHGVKSIGQRVPTTMARNLLNMRELVEQEATPVVVRGTVIEQEESARTVKQQEQGSVMDPDAHRRVSWYSICWSEAVTMKSKMQHCVCLSVAEFVAEAESMRAKCAQVKLFVMHGEAPKKETAIAMMQESVFIERKDSKTEKQHEERKMSRYKLVDNKVDKNWSVGGRTRHVDVRAYFLRDLKEDGIIEVEWIPTKANSSDTFIKNLSGPLFEKHAAVYCGVDEYMQYKSCDERLKRSSGESVGDGGSEAGHKVGEGSESGHKVGKRDSE